jgi:hypothetical protein
MSDCAENVQHGLRSSELRKRSACEGNMQHALRNSESKKKNDCEGKGSMQLAWPNS